MTTFIPNSFSPLAKAWLLTTTLCVTACTEGNPRFGVQGDPGVHDLGAGDAAIATDAATPPTGDLSLSPSSPSPDGSVPPAQCGVQTFVLQKSAVPDMVIVLDRSGSMNETLSTGGTKWSQITAAINNAAASLQSQIDWGLELFPNDDSCGTASTITVPVGPMTSGDISSAEASATPGTGDTPTTDAIDKATAYLTALNDERPKYLLLATDGGPTCNAAAACTCPSGMAPDSNGNCCVDNFCLPCDSGIDDSTRAEQAVANAAASHVLTFVVGIATSGTSADTVLNQMAKNGGEARAGATKYYPVASETDLETTLQSITTQLVSCNLALTTTPPDPTMVDVTLDGTDLMRDKTHMNGWDLGPGNLSIQLYGAACTQLQSEASPTVQAIFGCPPVN